jgi:hypothetical protein
MTKLLPDAASLVLDGGSNDICFGPKNVRCALRGQRIWQSVWSEKAKDGKQRRNTGTRGRNREQNELYRHSRSPPQQGSPHCERKVNKRQFKVCASGIRVDKSSFTYTDKEIAVCLSVVMKRYSFVLTVVSLKLFCYTNLLST